MIISTCAVSVGSMSGRIAWNSSPSGLIFGSDGPTIQRVKLYRYR